MNHLKIIIKREYLTKIRNKSFVIMTFLSPIIFILGVAFVTYISGLNSEGSKPIYVLDETELTTDVFKNSENTSYHMLKGVSLEDAKVIVQEANGYGLLHVSGANSEVANPNGITFYSDESPSINLLQDIESQLEKKLTNINLQEHGVDLAMINLVKEKSKIKIDQESFKGEKTSQTDSMVKLIFGGAAGYLLFMFIIIYGNMIMRSVIEEKTSRIIEVIISSVKPVQLMLGKIIGTSLAGVTQFVVWIVFGSILLLITSLIFGVDISALHTPQKELINKAIENQETIIEVKNILAAFYNLPLANLVIAFILFFLCGYLLYSSLYAAIGAAVDSETDTQQFTIPIIMPLMLSVYVGFFTVIEDPHGTVSTIFSFIPLTSPVVMLMRIPFGVPYWQQILSLAILIGSFLFAVWFAAKVYRVGILMYGKKPSYKELIKWIKY